MTGSLPDGAVAAQSKPTEPGPLDRTHRLFGGLRLDVKRRAPYYLSDWIDAVRPDEISRTTPTVLFLFFAAVVPAITFGNLYEKDTEASFGVVETILATAVSGVLYTLVAGQPITILGATGPIFAYTIVIYDLSIMWAGKGYFLQFYFWTLMWCSVITVIMVMFDMCALMRHVTRFSEDIFAGLISMIFIIEAIKPAFKGFLDGVKTKETAFLEVVLMAATYFLATWLANLRRQPWFILPVRAGLANFAVLISIVATSAFAKLFADRVELDKLEISSSFTPTMMVNGKAREWFVSPMGNDYPIVHIFSPILPAIGLAMLGYLDQNLTTVLVNRPSNQLKKPGGYHLDLFVRAVVCTPVCAFLGLPLAVASTVPSLTHVMALTTYTIEKMAEGERKVPVKVCEQRLTNMLIHIVLGASLFMADLLSHVPKAVLFGVFLYMGVASLNGNALYERILILLMWESKLHPAYEYVLNVAPCRMHLFTFIQMVCLGILYGLNAIKETAVAFPFFMSLLMVVRKWFYLIFTQEELRWLDGLPAPPEKAEQEGPEQGEGGASPAAAPSAV